MLLKLWCVVLALMFLNEVRLVTPASTTAVTTMTPSSSAAKMTPSSFASKTAANTKLINGTSIKPNNGTDTNSAGKTQHGGSVATTLTLMTIASFTMSTIWL